MLKFQNRGKAHNVFDIHVETNKTSVNILKAKDFDKKRGIFFSGYNRFLKKRVIEIYI